MKRCPHCAEPILDDAEECRSCGLAGSGDAGGRSWEDFFRHYEKARQGSRVDPREEPASRQQENGLISLFGSSPPAPRSVQSHPGQRFHFELARLWGFVRQASDWARRTLVSHKGIPLKGAVSKYGRFALPLVLVVAGLVLKLVEPPAVESRIAAMSASMDLPEGQLLPGGNPQEHEQRYLLTTDGANLRESPNGVIVRRTEEAERLEFIGREGNWNRVLLPDGREAFIHDSVVIHEAG